MARYKFRIRRLTATPYEVALTNWASYSADQMIDWLRSSEHFRDIDYFFNNSLVELEGMLSNIKGKKTLVTLRIPYKKVFPTITDSTIPKATLYIGPNDLENVYEGVRKFTIELLVDREY